MEIIELCHAPEVIIDEDGHDEERHESLLLEEFLFALRELLQRSMDGTAGPKGIIPAGEQRFIRQVLEIGIVDLGVFRSPEPFEPLTHGRPGQHRVGMVLEHRHPIGVGRLHR